MIMQLGGEPKPGCWRAWFMIEPSVPTAWPAFSWPKGASHSESNQVVLHFFGILPFFLVGCWLAGLLVLLLACLRASARS